MLKNLERQVPGLTVLAAREVPEFWPSARTPSAANHHIFQTREFIAAWQRSYGLNPRLSPYFVTVRNAAGTPVLLLPLCIERRKGVRLLTFLDQGQADYNAPVLFDAAPEWTRDNVRTLWTQILRALPRVDVALLEKMPARVGAALNPLRLLTDRNDFAACHGNQLGGDWAEVEKHLNSPKEVRKKERALGRVAPVAFVVAEDAVTQARLLTQLVEQKQRRYEETQVPGFAENPASLAFLKEATVIFGDSGNLILAALTAGDEIAAVQWGLKQDKAFYALITSFAHGPLAQFSPGRILNYRLIKLLHERGFTYFDQGFGDESYKLINTDTTVALVRNDQALTPMGMAFLVVRELRIRFGASAVGQRVRSLKWQLLRRTRQQRFDAGPPKDGGTPSYVAEASATTQKISA